MQKLIQIHPRDNVAVAAVPLQQGESLAAVTARQEIPFGHKLALRDIAAGEDVIKYGYPIGRALCGIAAGEHVHTHNVETKLSATQHYCYPGATERAEFASGEKIWFDGYEHADGTVGIRNDIWILPTVGCVNKTADQLAAKANNLYATAETRFLAFPHPYGCSQMGEDQENTQALLAALARHPNAAGVLLVSLGCENNNLEVFLPLLGDYDTARIRTLVTQQSGDELAQGLAILRELAANAAKRERVRIPAEKLVIGYKCGGSDAFSGITANPLCGRLTDRLCAIGARAILTEVPEMFGAETVLMERAENKAVFDGIVSMVEEFKDYYTHHNQVVYDNPSPGNKAGGITTLEEKSLGCIQKGGTAVVTDVLSYAQPCRMPGLNLLTGPGNDIVSCTNLVASGAHIIVFTTGRGTPLGAPVPTIKLSSNSALAQSKPGWIDYDAGEILAGKTMDEAAGELLTLLLEIASGKHAKNEDNAYQEIAIFKNGVTL